MWYLKFSVIKFHNFGPNLSSLSLCSNSFWVEFFSNNWTNSITFIIFSFVKLPCRVKLYFCPFSSSNSILTFFVADDRSRVGITSHLTIKVINKLTNSSANVNYFSLDKLRPLCHCSYQFSTIFSWILSSGNKGVLLTS